MWSAAEGNRDCAILEWLASRVEQLPPINFCGAQVPGREVATIGWEVLHNAMRNWGIESREGLSEWIHQQGFPRPPWGGHFSGRVQERILNLAIARVVRETAIESLYVHIVMHRLPTSLLGDQPRCNEPGDPLPSCTPWEVLDNVNLEEDFQQRFRVLHLCPAHLKGRFRQAARVALEARHNADCHNDHTMSVRAWKLFLFFPYMLLRKPRGAGRVGKDGLSGRFDRFLEGQWLTLLEDARRASLTERPLCPTNRTPERRAQEACQKGRLGEVSRARQCLTGAALAPGNEDTFRALQDKRPQQVIRPLTQEVLDFQPEIPVQLDRAMFLTSLKSAPRGSSPGPGGCTYEHLKVLLD